MNKILNTYKKLIKCILKSFKNKVEKLNLIFIKIIKQKEKGFIFIR